MYYHQESTLADKGQPAGSVSDPWPQGTAVSGLPSGICVPSLSSDELTIVFNNPNVGGWDMYIATRPNINSSFGNIRSLNEINTAGFECRPFLSPDALSIYWSNRSQIFEAIRSSLNDPFGNVQYLSALDMPGRYDDHPAISSDGTAIYFISGLSGQHKYRHLCFIPCPRTCDAFASRPGRAYAEETQGLKSKCFSFARHNTKARPATRASGPCEVPVGTPSGG